MRRFCKSGTPAGPIRRLFAAFSAVVCLTACSSSGPRTITVGVGELEQAASVSPSGRQRVIAGNPDSLASCYQPLGKRMGLVQVRSAAQWDALRAATGDLGPCPDLSQGIVIAIVSRAGLPIDGQWPISLDDVRVMDGAGLVRADFHAGTYLPDGTTYLEVAQIRGLSSVLMVDIDGVRFFP